MNGILIGRDAECFRLDADRERATIDKYLPAIRQFTAKSDLVPEDVIIRGMLLCNDERDYYYSRFSKSALAEVAELTPGRPVQASHTYTNGMAGLPIARFFAADVTAHQRIGGRKANWAETLFYLPNDDEGQRIARRIDLGIYREVSIGWRCRGATCNVCDEDIRWCGHIPGEVYERTGICDFEFNGITAVMEGSLVFAGGQKNTQTFIPEGMRSRSLGDDFVWREIGAIKSLPDYEKVRRDELAAEGWSIERIMRAGRAEGGLRQSLFALDCDKARFTERRAAAAWARDHDFRADKFEDRDAAFRFGQFDVPSGEAVKSIKVDDGVHGLMLKPRDKRDAGDAETRDNDVPLSQVLSR